MRKKLILGITRATLIKDLHMQIHKQRESLKKFGCTQIIHDPRARLPNNTTPEERMEELGVWKALDEAEEGAIVVAIDASRLVKNYLEFAGLMRCVLAHSATMTFLSEDFSSSDSVDYVKFIERMERLAFINKQESLKAGYAIYKRGNKATVYPRAKTLILKAKVAADLSNKADVVNTALKYHVSGCWIYGQGLNVREIQIYLASLTEEMIYSDSQQIHLHLQHLYRIEKKRRALERKANALEKD